MSLWEFVQSFTSRQPSRQADGRKAKAYVQTLEDMLEEASDLRESSERFLSSRQIADFKSKQAYLYLLVVKVRSDVRSRVQRLVFFASTADKDIFYGRAQKVLEQCEAYRTDVVSASSRARAEEARRAVQQLTSGANWVSFAPGTTGTSSQSGALTRPRPEDRGAAFLAALAQVPQHAWPFQPQPSQRERDGEFYHMLVRFQGDRCSVAMDPNPHHVSDSADDYQRSVRELSRWSDTLIRSNLCVAFRVAKIYC